ncbi:hypothetical protein L1987_54473 [Smallanthus sonchifolius]|uniref:Uncharacterized protein n=1 Tax=Smallanthus sonchifolius TaxID=185202 RepID=A0ACB9E7P2_9ASTR|nr:hypothetical protein L1987_54473 [Smallanthus sonchifolius]
MDSNPLLYGQLMICHRLEWERANIYIFGNPSFGRWSCSCRQTIQYIQPQEHGKLSQVEVLVIDELQLFNRQLSSPYLGLIWFSFLLLLTGCSVYSCFHSL